MYHLDYETFSACDIKLGAYRYACDPSTRILLCAVAYGTNPPLVWDSRDPGSEESLKAMRVINELSTSSEPVFAHNAPFELAVSKYHWENTFGCPPPSIERWRCTAAMCRRAAIPFSLAGAAEFLNLGVKKDKAGGRLIQLFSVPQAKPLGSKVTVDGVSMTEAEAWDMFREYCRRDVVVEREIHERLKAYEMTGTALEHFLFDLRMNDYGVPVDLMALHKAQDVVDEYNERMGERFHAITGLSPSQTMAALEWLRARGYGADNLQALTMEEWQDHPSLTPEAAEALGLRAALSFAATKKIATMIACACPDGRIRGSFMWYGAIRTGRWSGRLAQFQNVKRPTIKSTDVAYDAIRGGHGLGAIELLWDKPLEVVASIVRNFVREPEDDFIDTDFAQIEGRVAGWLAGDEELLSDFRAGVDVYKVMAGAIYSLPPEEVSAAQRMTGKVAVLSCGYGTGWARFQQMAADYGHELDDFTSKLTILRYRKSRAAIVSAWRAFGDAAVAAVRSPGEVFNAGEHVTFRYGKTGGFAGLLMQLPSGHRLVYPDPRIETREITADVIVEVENPDGTVSIQTEVRTFKAESITFYGPLEGKAIWGRVSTHGSKVFENASQAVAGDFLTHGLLNVQAAGYDVCSVIHDQALARHSPTTGHTLDRFLELITQVPSWAPGFPLKAEAHLARCYSK